MVKHLKWLFVLLQGVMSASASWYGSRALFDAVIFVVCDKQQVGKVEMRISPVLIGAVVSAVSDSVNTRQQL